MKLCHLLGALFLGRAAAEASPAEAIITAAPAPRAAALQPRQSVENRFGRSRELSDVYGLGIYSTRDCPQFQEPEFESSVLACFSSLVGGGDECEYGDKAEWLYARRSVLVERFSRCVCPVAEVVADSCLVGCPRHFTDVSIKQRWGEVCATQPTPASTRGSSAASATPSADESSASTTSLSDSAPASGTESEGAEETTGSSAGDEDSAAASLSASVWVVLLLVALALR